MFSLFRLSLLRRRRSTPSSESSRRRWRCCCCCYYYYYYSDEWKYDITMVQDVNLLISSLIIFNLYVREEREWNARDVYRCAYVQLEEKSANMSLRRERERERDTGHDNSSLFFSFSFHSYFYLSSTTIDLDDDAILSLHDYQTWSCFSWMSQEWNCFFVTSWISVVHESLGRFAALRARHLT